ncbi:vasculin-like protein 1 isoform X1 [Oncorhynchus nerka]|uniref:vasculin-like protein 1 isoform X1 n=1 Tax=Oncorhynchus nerka TaxID=8023 RepID=UPI0011321CF5|nr:vasculin-like protein 1 isoform X1 [Oncorhynchus nerka]XP_029498885.1 vasculin-like protein 1 isoform X1 [Oncorhynchus nerka]
MAQHDFVPAWLNFSTPQPAKSPAASLEKHGDPHHHRNSRAAVSRRRHNSSDGFFNNGPLHAPAGDGWQQPSLLLRHDSVDSGVAKGGHGGLAGGSCWKEAHPTWHGAPRAAQDRHHHLGRQPKRHGTGGGDRQGGHRQRNGNFHPRKSAPGTLYQDKFPNDEHSREDNLKFVEEDFPSLNPETTGKPGNQMRPVAPHAGVWENPPSGKQMVSKMLVIKKVSKEDPGCTVFSTGFASSGAPPINGSKALPTITSSTHSVYKNLVPKSAMVPTKPPQWKPSGRDSTKPGLHLSGRDSVFTSPVSAAKPATQLHSHNTPKERPFSTTPPIDITSSSRLKLMRRGPDRKSDFLRTLKDEVTGDLTSSSSPGTPGEGESSTPEPKAYSQGVCNENGLSHSLSDSDTDHLSSSLEAEHRLLKAMGWQEYPENDDSFLPLTQEELREFQTKTEHLKRNGIIPLHFTHWRCVAEAHLEKDEGSESETSSQTSDDDDVNLTKWL